MIIYVYVEAIHNRMLYVIGIARGLVWKSTWRNIWLKLLKIRLFLKI